MSSTQAVNLAVLAPFAFFAGYVDAVVGGGGLIQVPALFSVLPFAPPGALFGTNKVASVFGTSAAAVRYTRDVKLRWSMLLPAAAGALVFAFLGARAVSHLPVGVIRPLVFALMVAVAVHTLRRRSFGTVHAVTVTGAREKWLGLCVGAVLGFYDGFFGPGTGTFLIFVFVTVFGCDFLNASANAKLVNMTTNLAALASFVPSGNVLWRLALPMAACNMAGSFAGSHMALRRGSGFIRRLFLVVLAALLSKFAYDTAKLWLTTPSALRGPAGAASTERAP